MNIYAKWLFWSAAVFNFAIGGGLLFLHSWLIVLLKLDPIGGTNLVSLNLTGCFVGLFGYALARVAIDPVAHRPYIHLAVIGKLLAVVSVIVPWLSGAAPVALPVIVSADLVYAVLFLDYLRRTHRSPEHNPRPSGERDYEKGRGGRS